MINPKKIFRRLLVRLHRLAQRGSSAQQLALALAIGVFIAFTPTFGFHYISALLIAWLFGLSFPAIAIGTSVNNPLTIAPLYSFCLWIGLLLVGGREPRQPIEWNRSMPDWSLLAQLKPLLIPFVVGTLVVGVVAGLVSYGASYWLFNRLAQRRLQLKERGKKRVRRALGETP